MLNNQGNHDRGHDASGSRGYGNQFGAPTQAQGNLGGLHNMQGSYGLQNTLPFGQNRGLGNIAPGAAQTQQSRFAGQNLAGGLPQYSQVANRSGLPVVNGLSNQGLNRGAPNLNASKQGPRAQGPNLGGLGALGQNIQRGNPPGIPGLNNLGQRGGLPGLGLGSQFNVHQFGSPARSSGLGGYTGLGQGAMGASNQPSGDLLSMMNKGGSQSQVDSLGNNLGSLSQNFAQRQQQQKQAGLSSSQQATPRGPQDKDQAPFDASEFPALGGGLRGQNFGLPNGERPGSLDGANLYSNLNIGLPKTMLPEFSLEREEFPALPGASANARQGNEDRQAGEQPSPTSQNGPLGGLRHDQGMQHGRQDQYDHSPAFSSAQGYNQSIQASRLASTNLGRGSQTPQQPPGRGLPLGQQSQQKDNRFGLLGLLSVIRMTDQDLTTLALGTDLTTLGLQLNSSENVYKTFVHPWADNPGKPEPDFQVPECYKKPPPKLKAGYFSKFQAETLFYIFYSMPAEEAQVYAADELAQRGWFFHKDLKMWMKRAPGTEPTVKTAQLERGKFLIFDTSLWDFVTKELVVNYDMVERPPSLPR